MAFQSYDPKVDQMLSKKGKCEREQIQSSYYEWLKSLRQKENAVNIQCFPTHPYYHSSENYVSQTINAMWSNWEHRPLDTLQN